MMNSGLKQNRKMRGCWLSAYPVASINKDSFRRQGWALSQWLLKCLRLEFDVRGVAKTVMLL